MLLRASLLALVATEIGLAGQFAYLARNDLGNLWLFWMLVIGTMVAAALGSIRMTRWGGRMNLVAVWCMILYGAMSISPKGREGEPWYWLFNVALLAAGFWFYHVLTKFPSSFRKALW